MLCVCGKEKHCAFVLKTKHYAFSWQSYDILSKNTVCFRNMKRYTFVHILVLRMSCLWHVLVSVVTVHL